MRINIDCHYVTSLAEWKQLSPTTNTRFVGEGFYSSHGEWLKPDDVGLHLNEAMVVLQGLSQLYQAKVDLLRQNDLNHALKRLMAAKTNMRAHQYNITRLTMDSPFKQAFAGDGLKEEEEFLFNQAHNMSTVAEITAWLNRYEQYINRLSELEERLLNPPVPQVDSSQNTEMYPLPQNPYLVKDRRDAFETAWNRINEAHAAGRFKDFDYPELSKQLDPSLKRSLRQQIAAKALRMWRGKYMSEHGAPRGQKTAAFSKEELTKFVSEHPTAMVRDISEYFGVTYERASQIVTKFGGLKKLRAELAPTKGNEEDDDKPGKDALELYAEIKVWVQAHSGYVKREDKSAFYNELTRKYGYGRGYLSTLVTKIRANPDLQPNFESRRPDAARLEKMKAGRKAMLDKKD